MTLEGIKEDPSKWRYTLHSWAGRLNIMKISILLTVIPVTIPKETHIEGGGGWRIKLPKTIYRMICLYKFQNHAKANSILFSYTNVRAIYNEKKNMINRNT